MSTSAEISRKLARDFLNSPPSEDDESRLAESFENNLRDAYNKGADAGTLAARSPIRHNMRTSVHQMSRKGSVQRLIRQMQRALKDPYHGIMYGENNSPVEGDWVNGLRATDCRLLLSILRDIPGFADMST